MKFRKTGICLVAILLAATLTGCGEKEEPASSAAESRTEATHSSTQAAQNETSQSKHHITVESVEISLAELKAKNYTVPVMVRLDHNAGITYSEWGITMDKRCTFKVNEDAENLDFVVYHSINPKENFMWTAWASGSEPNTKTGNLLQLLVTLPRTAAAGDCYTVDYADWSKADKPHMWSNQTGEKDWVAANIVTWTDGTITVK